MNFEGSKPKPAGAEDKPVDGSARPAKSRSPWFAPIIFLGAFVFTSVTVLWIIQTHIYAVSRMNTSNKMTGGKAIWRLAAMSLFSLLLAAVLFQSAQAEGGGMESNSAPAQVSKTSASTVAADASATSPPLRFAHLTTDNGLSQNRVFAILQDRQGFMWFGTRDGLNRYDGNTFVVFKHNPADPASLSSNFILALLEDDQSCLWIGTYGGGVNRFDPATGRFTRYRHDPQNPNSLSGDMVKCITRDRRGNLWFGGDTGLNRFDPATETFTRYRNDSADQSVGMVNAIIEDRHGDIWFVGDLGLHHLNLQTGQIAHVPAPIAGATCLREDKAGNLWALVYYPIFGLVKYDQQAERFTSYPLDAGTIVNDTSNLLEDGENGFWVSSNLGLYYFDRQKERFTRRFQPDESNPESLSESRVVSLYRDRAGLLWVGTMDRGLNILNFQQEQFGCYRHDRTNTNSLSPGRVIALHPDPDGIVWAGFRARTLDRLDRKTGQITHYVPDNENTLNRDNDLSFICRDAQGYLWLGGAGSGLDRFDERTGQFKHYRHDPNDTNSLIADFVLTAYEDRSGNLWVGQYGGLSRLDRATERFTHYRPDPSAPTSVINHVAALYEDRSGVLWLGTWGGMLSRFDAKTETFVNYKPDSRDPHRLNGGLINAIHEDQAGTLWVGAEDGLYRFDRKNEMFTRYTEHQGLPGSAVIGILEDQAGRLWLGTKNGLSRFDPRTETFRNYDASDGLQSNDFSYGSCKQGLNGEMFFGGSEGFNAFFPENIRDNPYVPPVVLTDFQLFNKPVAIGKDSPLKKAINVADQITLRYEQNVFRLKFAALSFAQPQKNRYAYKLEGFDQDWRFTDAGDHSATYTRLAPGSYTFRVKASNNDGVWNEQGTSIKITVLPAWWMTWWFRGSAIAALLGLAFAVYRWRVRTIERRNLDLERQLIERKQAEETQRRLNRELRAISNCNQVLVRAVDEQALLNDICRIVCDEAGYRMAWVGYAENDEAKTVRVVARAGVEDGYLAKANITWADTERGRGPAGTAIRTGETAYAQDFNTSPQFAPWRESALQHGYQSVIALPLKDEDGRVFGVFLIHSAEINSFTPDEIRLLEELASDLAFGITILRTRAERKRTEEALHQSREEFKDLFDNAPVGFHEIDAEGRIIRINNTELKMLGYTAEELLGQFVWKISADEETSRRAALAKLSGEFSPAGFERVFRRKDGSTFPVLINDRQLKRKDGVIIGLYAAVRDITERKLAEASHARLAMAVEQATETIVITDTKGTILYVNPAFEKSTGYTRAEAVGQNTRILKSGKQDAEFYRRMWEVLERGEVWSGHFINKCKDGTFYEEEATISPIRDAAGQIVNYVAVKRDVTREVQLETQFRQSQKMEAIGQLAGGVAHDFNNILAVIQMQADLMGIDSNATPAQLESVREIANAAQRAAALTRQLLLFSRKQKLQLHDLDLNDSINDLTKMLRRTLNENIELQFAFAMQSLFVHADAGMLDQMLMNLAINSRDAMPEGGQLVIQTSAVDFDESGRAQSAGSRPGPFVCLSVSDTGCGIPPEILPKIFDPFFTTKEVGKGTGLGLATVFGIVQQHNGWINVDSEPGRGTTFRIYLPRLGKMGEEEKRRPASITMRGGDETILLVEDEAFLRVSLSKVLTQLGYRVLEAINGDDAIATWKKHGDEIHLLLTDLVMPGGINGMELAGQLLEMKPKLKVIFASGYSADVASKDFPLEEGVNFLAKPFEARKLAETVRHQLDREN